MQDGSVASLFMQRTFVIFSLIGKLAVSRFMVCSWPNDFLFGMSWVLGTNVAFVQDVLPFILH